MPRTVVIIQARMTSTRLPGKVLLDLAGKPMLQRVVERAGRAERVDEVRVATTDEPADDPIVGLCRQQGWGYSRGSRDDVLERYYRAAVESRAETIVRITSDCPLIDPQLIDEVLAAFARAQPDCDYASNILPPRTFPRGLDTEVFSFAALERAWREDTNPAQREHVTPYFYRNPQAFRLAAVRGADYSQHRWTVDTPEDFRLIQAIYAAVGHDRCSWREVLALVEQHPQWSEYNAAVMQKTVP